MTKNKPDGRTEIIPPVFDTPENVAGAIMMNKPKKGMELSQTEMRTEIYVI